MAYEFLNKLKLNELEELKDAINNSNSMDKMIMSLNKVIELKESNINRLIYLEQLWFSHYTHQILLNNNIITVDDLINCDVSSLKGIDSITSEEIIWGKKFYDFSNVNLNEKKFKKLN